jgi:PKD repeat protein
MNRLFRYIIPLGGLILAIVFIKTLSVVAQVQNTPATPNGELHPIGGYSFSYGRMTDHTALQVFTSPASVTISGVDHGVIGETYTFTATVEPISTTLPLSYTWEAQGQQPVTNTDGLTDIASFTWDVLGPQLITVTASNTGGSVVDSHVFTITDQPIEGLTANNNSPTIPGDVTTFTATITSGTNVNYTWDFGDDSNSSGAIITHTYTTPGIYMAMVTATNSVSLLTDTTSVNILSPIFPNYLPIVHNCTAPSLPLINSDFELGDAGWTLIEYSDIVTSENGIDPYSGYLMASIISYGVTGIPPGSIEQTFTIPVCTPYISFWWASYVGCGPVSGDRCGGDLWISIDGTSVASYHAYLGGIHPWQKIILDMSLYRGITVTLGFNSSSSRDSIYNYIDDLTFQYHP